MNKPPDPHRKALGRGLSSLLPPRTGTPASASAPATPENPPVSAGGAQQIAIDSIEPNPLQPRSVFQAERLRELSESIKANGIIQPLIVRRKGDRYELIAGERRWRAARLAELATVPVVVQELADEKLLEVALIENVQREDLNPIEVAVAYDRLAREHNLSHEEIGKRTGKDRATITNMIRLLRLPPEVQLLLAEHRLSMGHARALLGLPNQDMQRQVADRAAAEGHSVRQVERTVQKLTEPRDPELGDEEPKVEPKLDPNVKAAIDNLESALGTRVRVIQKPSGRGRIEIDFFSEDDLDRIYQLIVKEEEEGK